MNEQGDSSSAREYALATCDPAGRYLKDDVGCVIKHHPGDQGLVPPWLTLRWSTTDV
jgi:hypothetical protein